MTTIAGLSWAENRAHLRSYAEELIRDGAAVFAEIGVGTLGVEALELLYRRANNPEYAADSLKLLHELQTHQVELDVVLEQIQASESELTDELAHYQALYRLAPIAYLVIARNGRVIESNAAARTLLGFTPEHSEEQTLTQYLAPPGRTDVASMVEALEVPGVATCKAQLAGHPDFSLSINASLGVAGDTVMMVITPSGRPEPESTPF